MQQYYSAKLLFFSFIILFQQNANAKLCSSISMRDCNNFEIGSNGKLPQFEELIYVTNTVQAAANVVLTNHHIFTNTTTFIVISSVVDLDFDSSRKMSLALSEVTIQTVGQLTSAARSNSLTSLYTQKLL